ncbi:hypothetical protein DL96DRAFT_1621724 [Flagelloscypha sp. PMI_526]|nr:hypothetical protein DL96DRAFT_1621724 [Flagelloscypha sp. PMI_526]
MTPTVPPELWAQIVAFLPYASLDVAKRVNRAFYQICRTRLFESLDLVPFFTNNNVDERLEILSKRLSLASQNPTLVKRLRFMPSIRLPINSNPIHPPPKPVTFLKRIFRQTKKILTPLDSSWNSSFYPKANEIDVRLASLLPSLTSLDELAIGDSVLWPELWGPNGKLALSMVSSRLTVLSLQYPVLKDMYSHPNDPLIAFPVLRVLNLYLGMYPNLDPDPRIRKIISGSPLLREIQYRLISIPFHNVVLFSPLRAPTHPNLKVFKWTLRSQTFPLPQPIATSIPLTPLFKAHASQFHVVHIIPLPSFDVLHGLSVGQLVELRIDLNLCDDGADFFTLLTHADQLETLEVTGFRYSTATSDPVNLFPGLKRLRNLYLGIAFDFFSTHHLRTLASKTPDIHKLVFLIEPRNDNHLTPTLLEILVKHRTLLRDLDLPTVSQSLSKLKIVDFGILFRDRNGGVINFEKILMAISRRVPSIRSFYGTGSLRLWDSMENEIDQTWGGELWSQRNPKLWTESVLF